MYLILESIKRLNKEDSERYQQARYELDQLHSKYIYHIENVVSDITDNTISHDTEIEKEILKDLDIKIAHYTQNINDLVNPVEILGIEVLEDKYRTFMSYFNDAYGKNGNDIEFVIDSSEYAKTLVSEIKYWHRCSRSNLEDNKELLTRLDLEVDALINLLNEFDFEDKQIIIYLYM